MIRITITTETILILLLFGPLLRRTRDGPSYLSL